MDRLTVAELRKLAAQHKIRIGKVRKMEMVRILMEAGIRSPESEESLSSSSTISANNVLNNEVPNELLKETNGCKVENSSQEEDKCANEPFEQKLECKVKRNTILFPQFSNPDDSIMNQTDSLLSLRTDLSSVDLNMTGEFVSDGGEISRIINEELKLQLSKERETEKKEAKIPNPFARRRDSVVESLIHTNRDTDEQVSRVIRRSRSCGSSLNLNSSIYKPFQKNQKRQPKLPTIPEVICAVKSPIQDLCNRTRILAVRPVNSRQRLESGRRSVLRTPENSRDRRSLLQNSTKPLKDFRVYKLAQEKQQKEREMKAAALEAEQKAQIRKSTFTGHSRPSLAYNHSNRTSIFCHNQLEITSISTTASKRESLKSSTDSKFTPLKVDKKSPKAGLNKPVYSKLSSGSHAVQRTSILNRTQIMNSNVRPAVARRDSLKTATKKLPSVKKRDEKAKPRPAWRY